MAVLGNSNLIKVQTYGSGSGVPSSGTTSTSWAAYDVDQTNYTGDRLSGNNHVFQFTKISNTSDLKIVANIPGYLATGGAGIGIRLQISKDNSTWYVDAMDNGPAHGWGATGYGGANANIVRMVWNTELIDAVRSSGIYSHTGATYFYIQHKNWSSSDTYFPLHYSSATYPKYASFQCYEIER